MSGIKYWSQIREKTGKNSGYVMLVIALLGLLIQLSNIFAFASGSPVLRFIRFYLEPVYLSYFQLRLFEYSTDGGVIVFPNLIFYVLALIGAALYIRSKNRESRLLRFTFSIVLLSSSLLLLFRLIQIVVFFTELSWGMFFTPRYPYVFLRSGFFYLIGV